MWLIGLQPSLFRNVDVVPLQLQTPTGLSRVQMVDLAGSEREVVANDRSSDPRRRHERGGDSDGRTPSQRLTLSQRLRETAQIKKALSNLGIIIKGLSRGDTPVGLPFRDSILTWLLKVRWMRLTHSSCGCGNIAFFCFRRKTWYSMWPALLCCPPSHESLDI